MAASPRIFLLLVLFAVITLVTSNGIHGSAGFGFEAGVSAEHQSENKNDGHSESRFSFPTGIFFRDGNNANSEAYAIEHQIQPNELNQNSYNNVDGERKFRWPIPIPFFRSNEQNLEAVADYHTEPNRLSHEDPQYLHNHSAGNVDTDGERKFRWPSSVGITIKRSNNQNSELGTGTDLDVGQIGLNHEHHHHNHSAGNVDTDGERKFRWPSSVGIIIKRSNNQNSELGTGTDLDVGQIGLNHEHHHHNHSAGNNDTDGERKFRWPNSIGITITRSNKQNSDEEDEAKFFGLIPSLAPCNHTEQAGRSCYDCTHTLLCFANDIAVKRNCSPLYCNQGRCAVEPSVECSPAA